MRSSHPCTSVSVSVCVDVFVKFLKWKWKLVHLLQTEFALFSVVVLAISKEVQIGKAAFWWDISCLFNLCFSFVRSDMSLFVKRVCMFYLPCNNVSRYLFRFWWISAIFICGYNYFFWYPLEIQHLCLSIERLRTKKNEFEKRTFPSFPWWSTFPTTLSHHYQHHQAHTCAKRKKRAFRAFFG